MTHLGNLRGAKTRSLIALRPNGEGNGGEGYTWNKLPIFIASPMSPFSFSFPDMKAI